VPVTHIVQQGEHISAIAARYGFENVSGILDHPSNAELKAKRAPSFVLAAGDQVFIPDRVMLVFSRTTASSHDFKVVVDTLQLRLRFLDLAFKPRKNESVQITVDPPDQSAAASLMATQDLQTDGDGKVFVEMDKRCLVGGIVIDGLDYAGEVKIGELDPIDTENGVAQRLTNLGYIVPPLEPDIAPDLATERHDYDLRSSIEEFQCDQGMKLNAKHDDPALQAKLLELHGS
jgi:hypothetical protein